MFLTRFRVNTARPGARRLLSSPQVMHAAVMSSFPTLLPSTPRAAAHASCGAWTTPNTPKSCSTSSAPTGPT